MDIIDSYQNLSLHLLGDEKSDIVLFYHGQEGEDFSFLASFPLLSVIITGNDWDNDFTPYEAPSVFSKNRIFSGKGKEYASFLVEEMIPHLEEKYSLKNKEKWIAGYSLAGLFALYCASLYDDFKAVGCISGSLWYPSFVSYLKEYEVNANIIYLSVGDKESKTKNAYLKNNLNCYFEALDLFNTEGKNVVFDLNQGGHFDHIVERIQKGILSLLSQEKQIKEKKIEEKMEK